MERLTSPNINVDPGTDRFLHATIGGKEIDWKQSRDSTLNVLINGPTSNGFGKDIFRKMARDLYGRLKAYEDIAELCGGFDRLRELAEADKDGRVIILPCKVYETDGVRVYEHTVREVIYETAGGPAFDKNEPREGAREETQRQIGGRQCLTNTSAAKRR